jgi:hypothetical protein
LRAGISYISHCFLPFCPFNGSVSGNFRVFGKIFLKYFLATLQCGFSTLYGVLVRNFRVVSKKI